MGYFASDYDSYLAREVEDHYSRTEQEAECEECGRWEENCTCEQEPVGVRPCPPCPPVIAMAVGKAAVEFGDFERVRVLGGRLGRRAKLCCMSARASIRSMSSRAMPTPRPSLAARIARALHSGHVATVGQPHPPRSMHGQRWLWCWISVAPSRGQAIMACPPQKKRARPLARLRIHCSKAMRRSPARSPKKSRLRRPGRAACLYVRGCGRRWRRKTFDFANRVSFF